MIDKQYIQKVFEKDIIPLFFKYVRQNHLKVNQKQLKGELFTIIRRFLPSLTNELANYSICLQDIDYIGVNREGKVIFMVFTKSNYRTNVKIIDDLNSILNNIDISSNTNLACNLDAITDSLKYSQI